MHVVIAVDGSEARRAIVGEVIARSWAKESRFDVLNVTQPPHLWELSSTAEEANQRSASALAEVVNDLQRHRLTAEAIQREGDPRAVICEQAKEVRAELIIVGSHGTSGVTSFLLGSVSGAVVHHATCSVWIVRPPRRKAQGLKILLATDGSDCSEQVAGMVSKRKWPDGTEIRVLSAVDTLANPFRIGSD